MSTNTPWAILLCRFKDDVTQLTSFRDAARRFPFDQFANSARAILAHQFDMQPPISLKELIRNISEPSQVLQNVVTLFTAPDIENVVTYWQDISYGQLDLTHSEVFGWFRLDKNKEDYVDQFSRKTQAEARQDLVDWAKKAATDSGVDLGRFYGVVVYMNVATDLWGNSRQVVCDIASNLCQILQEVGHGYDLDHSRSVANPTDYENPFCIMSGLTFGGTNPTFQDRFGQSGPGLCSPYVFKAEWLSESRIARVATNGRYPASTKLILSPLVERNPKHPQVAMFGLNAPQEVTYFVEYRSGGWDRGLRQNAVVIHQLRPDNFAYYAGSIGTSVGFANGVTLLPGKAYVDSQFDLSVEVLSIFDDDTIKIRIAPAAAVQTLSVRTITRTKLGINTGFSVRNQVLQNRAITLRDRLVELLSQ